MCPETFTGIVVKVTNRLPGTVTRLETLERTILLVFLFSSFYPIATRRDCMTQPGSSSRQLSGQ